MLILYKLMQTDSIILVCKYRDIVSLNVLTLWLVFLEGVSVGHLVNRWRNPAGRLPWKSTRSVQDIDLFQGKTLGLGDEEVHVEEREQQTSSENETVVEVDGRCDEGGEERDQESPHPVGGGGDGHGLGSDSQWVRLGNDTVNTTGPGRGKEEDVKTGDENHGVTGSFVGVALGVGVTVLVQVLGTNERVDNETHKHGGGSSKKTQSSTQLLNGINTGEGRNKVDNTQNDRGLERVGQTNSLENSGTVVEEVVVTSQLLQRLKHNTHDDSSEDLGLTSDKLFPGSVTSQSLSLDTGLDKLNLGVDGRVVFRNLVGTSNGLLGLLDLVLLNQVSWRLGHTQHTNNKDDGPGETQSQWDSPGSSVSVPLGTVGSTVTQKDTQGDTQLEANNQSTSDLFRSDFGDEKRRDDRHGTDGETGNKTTDEELVPFVSGGDLDNDTDDVNDHREHKTDSSTVDISDLTEENTTDSTTNVENGDHQTDSDVGQVVLTSSVQLTESLDEVRHVHETGDGTSVETEHETTKGDEETEDGNDNVVLEGLFRQLGERLLDLFFFLQNGGIDWCGSTRIDEFFLRHVWM